LKSENNVETWAQEVITIIKGLLSCMDTKLMQYWKILGQYFSLFSRCTTLGCSLCGSECACDVA
jgi:hypothetical protein